MRPVFTLIILFLSCRVLRIGARYIDMTKPVTIRSECKRSNLSCIVEDKLESWNKIVWIETQNSNIPLNLKCTTPVTELTDTYTRNKSGFKGEGINFDITVNPQTIKVQCWIRKRSDNVKKLFCEFNPSKDINIFNETKHNIMHESENVTWFDYKIKSFNPFQRFIFRESLQNGTEHNSVVFEENKIVVLNDLRGNFDSLSMKVINSSPNNVNVKWKLPTMYSMYEFTHIIQLKGNSLLGVAPGRLKTRNTTDEIQFELDIHLEFAGVYNLTVYTCVKNALNWTTQHTRASKIFNNQKADVVQNESTQIKPEVFNVYINDVIFYFKSTASNSSESASIVFREMWKNGQLNIMADLNSNQTSDLLNVLCNLKPNNDFRCRDYASIAIPPNGPLLSPPQNLYLVQDENLYYNLSWTTKRKVHYFTIFWCTALDKQRTECRDDLKSVTVNGNFTSYVHNNSINGLNGSPKNFAISSTSNNQTSSMKWFTCTTSTKTPMTSIDKVFISRINSTAVKLSWDLPCERSPFVKAINITYCKSSDDICHGGFSHSVNLPSEVIIDGLELTNYTFNLAMFDGSKIGPITQTMFELTSTGSSVLYIGVALAVILAGIIFFALKFGIKRYKIIKDIHASIPMGLDSFFEPANITRMDVVGIVGDQKSKTTSDSDDHEVLQTITYEELVRELELPDLCNYSTGTRANITLNGNYIQVQQQNVGYVRIADLA